MAMVDVYDDDYKAQMRDAASIGWQCAHALRQAAADLTEGFDDEDSSGVNEVEEETILDMGETDDGTTATYEEDDETTATYEDEED